MINFIKIISCYSLINLKIIKYFQGGLLKMKFNIGWDRIRIFYYVAKSGSITAASEQINITQPAISRTIQNLESRLKFKLFNRHARGLSLTEQGEILFLSAEKMFSELESAASMLSEKENTPKGSLRIAAPVGIISRLLILNIEKFTKLYPELNLTIITSDNPPNFTFNEADVGIFPKIRNQTNLIQDHLLSFHLRLYASPQYIKNFGMPKTPKDLDHHRLISYGDHLHPFANINWHLAIGYEEGYSRKPYIQVNSGGILLRLAEKGIGVVTLAKESTNFTFEHDTLVSVLPNIIGPTIDYCYIYPHHLEKSKRIQALKSFFQEVIREEIQTSNRGKDKNTRES